MVVSKKKNKYLSSFDFQGYKPRCRNCGIKLYVFCLSDYDVWKKQNYLCNVCKEK